MGARYAFDRDYTYNTFGANEHIEVTLYKLNKKGTKWKPIQSWSFSTFFKERIAEAQAERRIRKLRSVYNAEAI